MNPITPEKKLIESMFWYRQLITIIKLYKTVGSKKIEELN